MKTPFTSLCSALVSVGSSFILLAQSVSAVSISVAATSTNENAGSSAITLALSAPAPSGAAVTARLVPISASTADFGALASTQITFVAGAQSAIISVPITNDTLAEPAESFQLVLSDPTNLTLPEDTSTHTIISEDAGIVLPSFFSDGMVLQREKGAAVWGFSLPGSQVSVSFGGQTLQATADASGRFQVTFNNLVASSVGRSLVISSTGVPTRTLNDVLVGEVWMGAGQSNMDFPLSFLPSSENDNEIATANDPLLRIFVPTEQAFPEPQLLVGGDWLAATPGDVAGFSALAYYTGKRLRAELGVPVAFIECAWGGQPIEGFVSEEKLATFPEGQGSIGTRDFFYGLFAEGNFDTDPRFLPNLAGQLYNGMIAPLVGYGMRGILWYQGEFNALSFNSDEYGPLLKGLAEDLRARWADDLPFYYVQLPNYLDPGRDLWINVQNAQRLALETIPNSGMMVGNDIGDINNIHPVNKSAFADRLVRWPLAKIYGQSSIVPSGPLYRSAQRQDSSIVVSFDYSVGLKTSDGGSLGGFELRNTDGDWVAANAVISGQQVIVTQPSLSSAPVGVRYAWNQNPTTSNLVNAVDLPTSIFSAVPSLNITELYRDSFNDTSIATNPDPGGGIVSNGTTGDGWSEGLGQISYSGSGGGNRANAYTQNDFSVDQGFTLEVDYEIASLATAENNQFSFGLFRNYTPNNLNSLVATSANAYGIGFNLTNGLESRPLGLVAARSGTTASTITGVSSFATATGAHRLSLTMVPDDTGGADYSYSYDGGVPVTGTIASFDFTSNDYTFVAHSRGATAGKSIQSVRLTSFGSGLPVLTASADPTNEGLIGLVLNFTLSEPPISEVSFRYDTVDGAAFSGQDYLPFLNRVLTFAPGKPR